MSLEMNARRIKKIYHGSELVYEDTIGRWINLKLSSPFPETVQYLDTGTQLIFKGKSNSFDKISRGLGDGSMPIIPVPEQYKKLALSKDSIKLFSTLGTDDYGYSWPISVSGNSVMVSNPQHIYSITTDVFLSGIILDYTK